MRVRPTPVQHTAEIRGDELPEAPPHGQRRIPLIQSIKALLTAEPSSASSLTSQLDQSAECHATTVTSVNLHGVVKVIGTKHEVRNNVDMCRVLSTAEFGQPCRAPSHGRTELVHYSTVPAHLAVPPQRLLGGCRCLCLCLSNFAGQHWPVIDRPTFATATLHCCSYLYHHLSSLIANTQMHPRPHMPHSPCRHAASLWAHLTLAPHVAPLAAHYQPQALHPQRHKGPGRAVNKCIPQRPACFALMCH